MVFFVPLFTEYFMPDSNLVPSVYTRTLPSVRASTVSGNCCVLSVIFTVMA